MKSSYNKEDVHDLKDLFLRRRDKLRIAALADMQVMPDSTAKFTFPYANDLILLELEGDGTHQSDQKYCERTKRDVIRKGIDINNFVNFSILSELK